MHTPIKEFAEIAIMSEVRAFPEFHQSEYALADSPLSGFAVTFEQVQFLETFENPEGEIDLDAGGIENLSVEIVRQSFANQQLVDFGAPARSL